MKRIGKFLFILTAIIGLCFALTACNLLNKSDGEPVHEHSLGEWIAEQPATCDKDGIKGHYLCADCNKYYDRSVEEIEDLKIPAKGHKLDPWVAEYPVGCVTNGRRGYYFCNNCGKYFAENKKTEITDLKIPSSGHSYGSWIEYKDSTCTEKGHIGHYRCSGCEKCFDREKNELNDVDIPVKEHTFGDWQEEIPAKCDEDGTLGHFRCSVCKKNYDSDGKELKSIVIKAEHVLGSWIDEAAATCGTVGHIAHYTCLVCGTNFDAEKKELASVIIPVTDSHKMKDGECTVCHQKESTVGLDYILGADKLHYIAAGIGSSNATDIVIASNYEGLPVTEIASSAFASCRFIKSVTVPATINVISENAFADCYRLEWLKLHDDIVYIGRAAFAGCRSITEFSLPRRTVEIGDEAFLNCSAIEVLTVKSALTKIGERAFDGCTSLEKICYDGSSATWEEISKGKHWCDSLRDVRFVYTEERSEGLTLVNNAVGLTVTGYIGEATEIHIPAHVNGVSVTEIADGAFQNSVRLVYVNLPDGITSIGARAFAGCIALKEIVLPTELVFLGDHAFDGCTELEGVVIPDGITTVPSGAFNNCSALTEVTVSKNVVSIRDGAFSGCSNLTTLLFRGGIRSIGRLAFANCYSLKSVAYGVNPTIEYSLFVDSGNDCLRSASKYYFVDCIHDEAVNLWTYDRNGQITTRPATFVDGRCSLCGKYEPTYWLEYDLVKKEDYYCIVVGLNNCTVDKVVVPDEYYGVPVKAIGDYAFKDCLFTEIILPDTVTEIGQYAFADCEFLKSVDLSNITVINDYLFYNCTSLEEVVLSSELTKIGDFAFKSCKSLKEIVLPVGLTDIGDSSFENCSSIKSIAIPEGVKNIGTGVFSDCRALSEVSLPTDITTIPGGMFSWCRGLTEIVIPAGVKEIQDGAFAECTALNNIVLRNGLEYIGQQAFFDCSSLKEIVIPESVTYCGSQLFELCDEDLKVYYGGSPERWNGNGLVPAENLYFYVDCIHDDGNFWTYDSHQNIITEKAEFKDRICTVCGVELSFGVEPSSDGLLFELLSDGSGFAVKGRLNNSDPEIAIPSVHNGLSVTAVASAAFEDDALLRSVVLPATLVSIGDYAFKNCYNLEYIKLTKGVAFVGNYAFYGCSAARYAVLDKGLSSVGSSAFGATGELAFYFEGQKRDFERVTVRPDNGRLSDRELYYYVDCVHSSDSFVWTYDSDGKPTTQYASYENGRCVSCGMLKPGVSASYTLSDSKTYYTVTPDTSGSEELLVIAESKAGLPVRSIADAHLAAGSSIKAILIPTSVTEITLGELFFDVGLEKIYYSGTKDEFLKIDFKTPEMSEKTLDDLLKSEKVVYYNECIRPDEKGLWRFAADGTVTSAHGGFSDGVCDVCGRLDSAAGLTFELSSDELYYIVKGGEASLTEIVIPDIKDGLPVKTIAASAFSECIGLTKITFGRTIKAIGKSAFDGLSALAEVNYIGSIENWRGIVFDDEKSNPVYYSHSLTVEGEALTELSLELATSVGAYQFIGLSAETVLLGDKLVSVGKYAFANNSRLSTLVIPASVTEIGEGAFSDCESLIIVCYDGSADMWESVAVAEDEFEEVYFRSTCIHVSDKGLWYYGEDGAILTEAIDYVNDFCPFCSEGVSDDGLLFRRSETLDYCVLVSANDYKGTDLTIPEIFCELPVTAVPDEAFAENSDLKTVTLPDSLTSIGNDAFADCTSLESVTIGRGLELIAPSVFAGCSRDLVVYYLGSEQGWRKISLGEENLLSEVKVYFFSECGHFADKYWRYGDNGGHDIALTSYVNGFCPICGKEESTDEIVYELSSDGKYYIAVDIQGKEIPETVVIASEYMRLPVASVAAGALQNDEIKTVFVPDSIKVVERGVFGEREEPIIIYYYGRETMWNNILLSSDDDRLREAKVYFYSECSHCPDKYWRFDGDGKITVGLTDFVNDFCPVCKTPLFTYGLEFTLSADGRSYSVSGINDQMESALIPVYYCGLPVTAIADNAFSGNKKLKSITVPDGVRSIGAYAFDSCTSLEYIGLADRLLSIGDGAFRGCTKLGSITLPDSLKAIGNSAFYDCGALTSINIPENITSIGNSLFHGCAKLNSITLPFGVRSIGAEAFFGCTSLTSVFIPDSVTSISDDSFSGCDNITSISLPASAIGYIRKSSLSEVTITSGRIADSAFLNCSALTSVTLGAAVTAIGKNAFLGCSGLKYVDYIGSIADWCIIAFGNLYSNPLSLAHNLNIHERWVTEIVIPNTVTSIGQYQFSAWNGTSIVIPASVTSIGSGAFYYCRSLTGITIPASVTSIGAEAFYACTSLTSVIIPDSVTSIGAEAFYACTSLTSVIIPDSVTSIGAEAFLGCMSLTSVIIPDSVTSISDDSFSGCDNITSISLPASAIGYIRKSRLSEVTITSGEIADSAFLNCSALTRVTLGTAVTTIGNNAFRGCSGLEFVYYKGNIADWCNIAFNGYYSNPLSLARNLYINNELVTEIVIPNTVMSIRQYQFSAWNGTSITLPFGVRSIGVGAFENCTSLTSVIIPDSVTSISGDSFSGCDNITEITLPASAIVYIPESSLSVVTITSGRIADSAFLDCSALTSVTISDAVTSIGENAFNGCVNITEATLPASAIGYIPKSSLSVVKITSGRIADSAFLDCSSLTRVTISDAVTSIGENAFSGCENLVYEEYNNGYYIGNDNNPYLVIIKATSNSITSCDINENCKFIYDYAFSCCGSLTSITIPSTIKKIGKNAFADCTGLTEIDFYATECEDLDWDNGVFDSAGQSGEGISVYIGMEVTKVPAYLFNPSDYTIRAPKITYVVFAYGSVCETIGSYAFGGCVNLKSIVIYDGVTSIGDGAFVFCGDLQSVVYYGDIADWCNIAFNGYYSNPLSLAHNIYINHELVTEIVIPNTVTSIGDYQFCGWIGTSITIPESVTSIGSYAFGGCGNLTSIVISDGITSIGDGAFYKCGSLASITIPSTIKKIGENAFADCTGLTEINFNATECEDLDSNSGVFEYAGQFREGITVNIGSNVTRIPENLFRDGCYIRSVVFAEGSVCETIGSDAFRECSNLTSIVIPDSVTSIGSYAFAGCLLTSIELSAGLKSIGESAFLYRLYMSDVYYNGSLADWCEIEFASWDSNPVLGSNLYINNALVTEIVIPNTVTSIGDYQFYGWNGTSIVIHDNVTSIGSKAFYYCSSLTDITIPATVTYIGDRAFDGCDSLNAVYYSGTAEQWSDVIIVGISSLTDAELYYFSASDPYENNPDDENRYWYYVDGEVTVWSKQP